MNFTRLPPGMKRCDPDKHNFVYTGLTERCANCTGKVLLKIHKCTDCGYIVKGDPAKVLLKRKDNTEMSHQARTMTSLYQKYAHFGLNYLYPGLKNPVPDPDLILKNDPNYVPIYDHTWPGRRKVSETYVNALQQLVTGPLPDLQPNEGEGIVFVGGDNNKFDYGFMIGLTIRNLIEKGWRGKIEWWVNTPMENINPYHLKGIEEFIQFRYFKDLPIRYGVVYGWWNKILALAYSSFRYALLMDADAHFVRRPDELFEFVKKEGNHFCYWSKLNMPASKWLRAWLGGFHGTNPINGGHLLMDREKSKKILLTALFIAQNHIYFDPDLQHIQRRDFIYGDEDAYQIAIASVNKWNEKPFQHIQLGVTRANQFNSSFGGRLVLECSFGNSAIIAHRITGKLGPWQYENDNMNVAGELDLYSTWCGIKYDAPLGWRFRMHRDWDAKIYKMVCVDNEYKIPKLKEDDIFLDIGANIGSAANAAYNAGSRNIHCVEPHPDNLVSLKVNASLINATVYEFGVWQGTVPGAKLSKLDDFGNIGAFTLEGGDSNEGPSVEVRQFDDFVESQFGEKEIRFLKLDCEHAEKSILLQSNRLQQFQTIAAEIHCGNDSNWKVITSQIQERLISLGFLVNYDYVYPHVGQGLLFAERNNKDEFTKVGETV